MNQIARKIMNHVLHPVSATRELLGLNETFLRAARGCRILIYHGICEQDPLLFNTLFITRERFESHLRFFKQYFHLISLDDFYAGNFREDRFNLCLSFDDGFANNHRYVLPLLQEYEVPAVFFVTAIRDTGQDILWNDYLTIASRKGPEQLEYNGEIWHKKDRKRYVNASGNVLAEMLRSKGFEDKRSLMQTLPATFKHDECLTDYWLQMTPHQLQEMAASPWVTLGSHGYYHNDLAKIPREAMRSELSASKNYLEQIIQKPVTALAFPYGSYSQAVVEDAIGAGYTQLLAAELIPGQEPHPALRARMGINPFISTQSQAIATVKGKYYE